MRKIPFLPLFIEKLWPLDRKWSLIHRKWDSHSGSKYIYYNFDGLYFVSQKSDPFMGSWVIGGTTK